PKDVGVRVIRVKRPPVYFNPSNPRWPNEVEIRFVMPPLLEEAFGAEGARQRIAEEVKRLEHEAWHKAEELGTSFKAAKRVMRVPHTARARSYEVFGKLNPRFTAAGDSACGAEKAAALRAFDAAYERALRRWTAGDRRAVFPYGTWWMRVHHGARVRP